MPREDMQPPTDTQMPSNSGGPEQRSSASYEWELRSLRESEAHYRALFELGPAAIYSCDASGAIRNCNRRAVELWGRRPILGHPQERFCGSLKMFDSEGRFIDHAHCPMGKVLAGTITEARDAEVVIERPDGSRIIVVMNVRSLKNPLGEITGAINCFYDVTERKEAERRQLFLMGELEHRGKNLIALIQSIVSLSLAGPRSLAEGRKVLTQRINALARGQSVLAIAGFEGGSVSEIIRLELQGFSSRVEAVGPEIMLNPKVAQTFTFVVHELATNATKYGALSGPSGRVAIQWSTEGIGKDSAKFKFQWQELDGPPVNPPVRRGFGRLLLEEAVALDFNASPRIDFEPEGLVYEIEAPLAAIAVGGAPRLSAQF
jgi:PAS domain S-box-containing protein